MVSAGHRREGSTAAAVPTIDVLDDLLSALVLKVDIDVRGSLRSLEMKRSNSMFIREGSNSVMPNAKQTAEFAAEPRPWQSIFRSRAN